MKNNTILAILFLALFYVGTAQEINEDNLLNTKKEMKEFLTDKVWDINGSLGTQETYLLKEYVISRSAGFKTTFSNTMSFISKYEDSCGNGTGGRTISGNYRLISRNKIEIIIKTDKFHNRLELPIEILNPKKLVYIISKSKNGLLFTKENK